MTWPNRKNQLVGFDLIKFSGDLKALIKINGILGRAERTEKSGQEFSFHFGLSIFWCWLACDGDEWGCLTMNFQNWLLFHIYHGGRGTRQGTDPHHFTSPLTSSKTHIFHWMETALGLNLLDDGQFTGMKKNKCVTKKKPRIQSKDPRLMWYN